MTRGIRVVAYCHSERIGGIPQDRIIQEKEIYRKNLLLHFAVFPGYKNRECFKLLFIFIPHFIPLVFPVFSVFLCNERLLFGRKSQTFGSKIDPDKPYFFTKMRLGVIPEIAAPPIPFFVLEKSRAAPAGYRLVRCLYGP